MKNEFKGLQSGATYFNRVMDWQANRETPLLDLSRMVLAETYMNGLSLMSAFDPMIEPYKPAVSLVHAATFKGEVMDVAAFNLTKFYGSTAAAMENIGDMGAVAARFHAVNAFMNEHERGICSIISQHTAEIDPETKMPKSEVFLVCYPGALGKDGWEKSVNLSRDKCKSQFFAHLLHEGLVTEKDIHACNLNLGKYGHEIAQEVQNRGGGAKSHQNKDKVTP